MSKLCQEMHVLSSRACTRANNMNIQTVSCLKTLTLESGKPIIPVSHRFTMFLPGTLPLETTISYSKFSVTSLGVGINIPHQSVHILFHWQNET